MAKRLTQAAATTRVKIAKRLSSCRWALRRIFSGVALVIIDQANAKKQITPEFQVMMRRVGRRNQSGSRMQTNPETTIEISSRGLASNFLSDLGVGMKLTDS